MRDAGGVSCVMCIDDVLNVTVIKNQECPFVVVLVVKKYLFLTGGNIRICPPVSLVL